MDRVHALLALAPGLPDGDTRCGLDLSVRLTPGSQLDAAAHGTAAECWAARRFWPGREDWRGELVRAGEGWAIRAARGDNEPLWDLEGRLFRPGDYLTLRRPGGEALTFRIVGVGAEPR